MEQLIGVGLVVLASICAGINPILARFIYSTGVSPASFLFLRFLFAGIIMFVIMRIQHRRFPTGNLLWTLIFVGGIGMMASTWCYYTALLFSPPGIVAVLAYTYPVIVAIFSTILLKTPVTKNMIIALGLTLTGVVLTVGSGTGCGEFKGMFLAWLAGAIFAFYIIFGSVCIKKAGSIPALAVTTPAAALAFLPIVAVQGLSLPSHFIGWLGIGFSILISTVLGMYLFFLGLKRINPTDASMISTFEIVVVIVLSTAFLDERIGPIKIFGAAFILAAVILLARSGKMKRRVPRLPEPGMIGFKRGNNNGKEQKT